MITKRTAYIAIVVCALVGIFSPTNNSRSLVIDDEENETTVVRQMQQNTAPTPPPAAAFSCPPGKVETRVDWGNTHLEINTSPQEVTLSNGIKATISYYSTAPGRVVFFGFDRAGNLELTVENTIDATDIIDASNPTPEYPAGYGTMVIDFHEEVPGMYISIGDVDSGSTGDAVRIRMFDAAGQPTPTTISKTGTIIVQDNIGYEGVAYKGTSNPGYESSLYAKADTAVKRIELDQSMFSYSAGLVGSVNYRTIYPALDFAYCSDPDTLAPSAVPDHPTPSPTMKPTPYPTPAKVENTPYPQAPIPLPVPVPVPTTPAPVIPVGANGDPIIMGLSGQIFKFDGRSGAWYSAISTESFQWNMKLQRFESCPDHSDNFITGTGLTIYNGNNKHEIIVSVVNEHHTDIGCGSVGTNDYSCLGAGSLELTIDGHKIVQSIDHSFEDGSGRVIAFNTVAKCSRRWFDFDVTPVEEIKANLAVRHRRRLVGNSTDMIIDMLEETKATMVDQEACSGWLKARRQNGDLFKQTGTWSTIIVKTDAVSFHIEYKQEQERCSAHSLDMWVSSVNPDVAAEQWEGVIGETKGSGGRTGGAAAEHLHVSRHDALKYADDEAYEVNSPFASKCAGCIHH